MFGKLRLLSLVGVLGAVGCAHAVIPGTKVVDTEENREVVDVVRRAQEAMKSRDLNGLIAVISKSYFETLGNSDPKDDYGYQELTERILPRSFSTAKEIQLNFEIHDVVIEGADAFADIRYHSRAKLELPAGTLWDSHREFSRIRLSREGQQWLITGGL